MSIFEEPFTLAEIKNAVFDMGADKALGPDGFSMLFYSTFGIILNLISSKKKFSDLFSGSANLSRINYVVVALIPKVEGANLC